jgi:hypothetical protein
VAQSCLSVANYFWSLPTNWDALSAIGTIAATLVALFLPTQLARREWARQDSIRQAEADRAEQYLSDTQQEVCSAVDRILAYREAAIAIFDSEPVYFVGIQAVRRINLNTSILQEMLAILENRPDLTDGALYSAVSAKRVAKVTVEETSKVITSWGTLDPCWNQRAAVLENSKELASMAKARSDGVRNHWKLNAESVEAKKIRDKYLPLAAAIKSAKATDSGPPEFDLTLDYA